ncbi:hypothetical protein EXIGLDRAFT_232819 [Exidia glandulosa HHB12029]|uniref:Uncharacterized protein n=1 Tax=Exidia glandulosa HHB12029 TaxID=1314781 RepID=A0A165E3V3_EXIGL|nr:hypothetical protein EXIGLDRAFT_232819 [Exidia glandulosa HHB12029]
MRADSSFDVVASDNLKRRDFDFFKTSKAPRACGGHDSQHCDGTLVRLSIARRRQGTWCMADVSAWWHALPVQRFASSLRSPGPRFARRVRRMLFVPWHVQLFSNSHLTTTQTGCEATRLRLAPDTTPRPRGRACCDVTTHSDFRSRFRQVTSGDLCRVLLDKSTRVTSVRFSSSYLATLWMRRGGPLHLVRLTLEHVRSVSRSQPSIACTFGARRPRPYCPPHDHVTDSYLATSGGRPIPCDALQRFVSHCGRVDDDDRSSFSHPMCERLVLPTRVPLWPSPFFATLRTRRERPLHLARLDSEHVRSASETVTFDITTPPRAACSSDRLHLPTGPSPDFSTPGARATRRHPHPTSAPNTRRLLGLLVYLAFEFSRTVVVLLCSVARFSLPTHPFASIAVAARRRGICWPLHDGRPSLTSRLCG